MIELSALLTWVGRAVGPEFSAPPRWRGAGRGGALGEKALGEKAGRPADACIRHIRWGGGHAHLLPEQVRSVVRGEPGVAVRLPDALHALLLFLARALRGARGPCTPANTVVARGGGQSQPFLSAKRARSRQLGGRKWGDPPLCVCSTGTYRRCPCSCGSCPPGCGCPSRAPCPCGSGRRSGCLQQLQCQMKLAAKNRQSNWWM
jgi:hypothetical protein